MPTQSQALAAAVVLGAVAGGVFGARYMRDVGSLAKDATRVAHAVRPAPALRLASLAPAAAEPAAAAAAAAAAGPAAVLPAAGPAAVLPAAAGGEAGSAARPPGAVPSEQSQPSARAAQEHKLQ